MIDELAKAAIEAENALSEAIQKHGISIGYDFQQFQIPEYSKASKAHEMALDAFYEAASPREWLSLSSRIEKSEAAAQEARNATMLRINRIEELENEILILRRAKEK